MSNYDCLQEIGNCIDYLEASHIISKCDSIYLWDTALEVMNTSQSKFNAYTNYIRNLI